MSAPMDKFHVDHVNLEALTIIKASIENTPGISSLPQSAVSDIQFQLKPGVNWDLKKVKIIFDCSIKVLKSKDSSEELGVTGNFEIAYVFMVDNLHEIAVEDKSADEDPPLVKVPGPMVSSLSNIAYSTSRGVIFTRCLGTVLGSIILPVLSTKRIVGEEQEEES
jgi:hypothetical protein